MKSHRRMKLFFMGDNDLPILQCNYNRRWLLDDDPSSRGVCSHDTDPARMCLGSTQKCLRHIQFAAITLCYITHNYQVEEGYQPYQCHFQNQISCETISHLSVAWSFCSFAQRTIAMLSCSVQNLKMIGNLKKDNMDHHDFVGFEFMVNSGEMPYMRSAPRPRSLQIIYILIGTRLNPTVWTVT